MFKGSLIFLVLLTICCISEPRIERVTETYVEPSPSPLSGITKIDSSESRPITRSFFALSIPKSLREQSVKGMDSNMWEFSNDDITVSLESGPLTMTLEDWLKNYSDYTEEWKTIDGELVKTVSFNYGPQSHTLNDPSKNNIVAVHFPRSARTNNNLTVWVSFRSPRNRQTAIDIIESVRFIK
jgi:hypothetical protein